MRLHFELSGNVIYETINQTAFRVEEEIS